MRGRLARWLAFGAVGASLALAIAFSTRFGSDPGLVDSPLLGNPAPSVELVDLRTAAMVDLDKFRGDIVVVNFFASWCLQCRTEHPALLASADAFSDRGVSFVQIAYDDRPDDSRAFLDELGWSDHTTYVTDPSSRAAIGFGLRGVPETFFIDRQGIVRGKISGESNALLLGQTLDVMLAGGDPGSKTVGDVQTRGDE